MACIAGEVAQPVQRRFQPPHERIDGGHQPAHLAGHRRFHRAQIAGIAGADRIAQPVQRPQRQGDRQPDNGRRAPDHQCQPQRRPQQDGAGQLLPGIGGFGHGHHEGQLVDPGRGRARQRRQPHRHTAKGPIGKGRAAPRHRRGAGEFGIAGHQLAGRCIDAVEHPVLRGRAEHFQRAIGDFHRQLPVFGQRHPFRDHQRRSGQNPVSQRIGGLRRLAPGVDQRRGAQNRRRHQQPQQKAAAQGIGGDHGAARSRK